MFRKDDSDWFLKASKNELKQNEDPEIKPFGQILAEITLGKDITEDEKNLTFSEKEITYFKNLEKNKLAALKVYEEKYPIGTQKYQLIQQYRNILEFSKTAKQYDLSQIKQWANAKTRSANIAEFIAILDRANFILEGHTLRDTQILAMLIFLNTEKNKGRLCQILTGEGKTTIVAFLAIIKASRGEKVDVITSNPVLAAEGVNKKKKLYELFHLNVQTNNPLPDESYQEGPKICYHADVLYGCISNFQFDYLRDTLEGLETRAGRPFGTVILDEVDSIVIDNGSHIAKLSGPLPGMEYFRYIYVNIWDALDKHSPSDITTIKNSLIKQKLHFIPVDMIPGHLLDFANTSLERWIENAIYAKYHCHEDKQYIIREKEGEMVIVPVDYSNTGVTLNDTLWSYGLHQFLQLKHGLYLSPENLTSSFISNLGYINKYKNNMYGLTGTLGSVNEQSLISEVYHVDYAKLPGFKNKKFFENPGMVAADEEWLENILNDIGMTVILEKRAVLVIAETIFDAKSIQVSLQYFLANFLSPHSVKIRTYIDEEIAEASKIAVDVGHVVISTNIAGRGTDLETTDALEKNGGLHVIVGFLPRNKRVEQQAFGRTSRQGKSGSAKLIIRQSEVPNQLREMSKVKEVRKNKEKSHIEKIREIKIPELRFDDEIFSLFSDLYSSFKKNHHDDSNIHFLCYDLKEWWAFFLESLNKKDKTHLNANIEFYTFYHHEKTQKILNKKMAHNPYYAVNAAEHWIKNSCFLEAEDFLKNALQIAVKNPEILYPLYLKYFEICIENSHALAQRIDKAIGDIFFLDIKPNENAKEAAIKNLWYAKKGIEKELDFINPDKNKNPFIPHFLGRWNALHVFHENMDQLLMQMQGEINEEKLMVSEVKFENDMPHDFKVFQQALRAGSHPDHLKQMTDTVIHRQMAKHLNPDEVADKMLRIKQDLLNSSEKNKSQPKPNFSKDNAYVIASRKSDYFDQLDKQKIISKKQLAELFFIGLENIYALKTIHPLDPFPVNVARVEMLSGIALEAASLASQSIPFVSKPLDISAGLFITESICGLIVELFNGGEAFHEKEYWKNKQISYAVSAGVALLGGIVAMAHKSQHVARIKMAFIQKMHQFFKFSPLTKSLKLKTTAMIAPKIATTSTVLRTPGFYHRLAAKLGQAGKMGALNQMMDKLIQPELKKTLESIKSDIQKEIKKILEIHLQKIYLQNISKEIIIQDSTDIIREEDTSKDIAEKIVQGIAGGSLQQLKTKNFKTNVAGYGLGMLINNSIVIRDLSSYAMNYCKKLNDKLSQQKNTETNDVDAILKILVDHVVEKINHFILELVSSLLREGIIDPAAKMGPHSSHQNNLPQKKIPEHVVPQNNFAQKKIPEQIAPPKISEQVIPKTPQGI